MQDVLDPYPDPKPKYPRPKHPATPDKETV